MKKLIIATILLGQTLAWAEEGPTHFACGSSGHGNALSIQFEGPRYADWIFLKYLEEDIKKFLMKSELDLKVGHDASFTIAATMGTCKKIEEGNVLLSCSSDGKESWDVSNYNFDFVKENSEEKTFKEYVRIQRQMNVNRIDLKIVKAKALNSDKKEIDVANLELNMNVDLAHKDNVDIKIEKRLGSLEQDWYMCKFTNLL